MPSLAIGPVKTVCICQPFPPTAISPTTCSTSCCPRLEIRQALIEHLKASKILSVFHYLPLHLSDMGRQFRWCRRRLPGNGRRE
jgi:dTDP-4-amino-4,6-dideoxygalactose transaminase